LHLAAVAGDPLQATLRLSNRALSGGTVLTQVQTGSALRSEHETGFAPVSCGPFA